MPLDLLGILHCLDVTAVGPHAYEGDNYPLAYRRVFGGQLLGQALRAAHHEGDGKQIKSLSMLFPREGDPEQRIRHEVATAHSGRTFSAGTVTSTQGDRCVAVATVSWHAPEPGPELQLTAPDTAPPEDGTPTDLGIVPWDVSVVEGGSLTDRRSRPPVFRFWMRAPELAVQEPWASQALLAHASDPTVIGTALLPLDGMSQADAQVSFRSAVTSHTLWFHAPFRVQDWLLFDQHSPVLRGSRAFGRADVWTRDGRLVASLAQESMVRMTAPEG